MILVELLHHTHSNKDPELKKPFIRSSYSADLVVSRF